MRCSSLALVLIASTAAAPRLGAQAIVPPGIDTVARPAANAADVGSVDAILKALYDVISGPAGQARNWDRFRSLLVPNARLMPTGARPNGGAGVAMLSGDDYVKRAGPGLEKNGFFEVEVHRVVEHYGNIMHAFSTYESRRTADPNEKPFSRGINSIQLLKDGGRYWIVSIFWDSERPGNELPGKYLPK